MSENNKNILIIGSGLSGLCVASHLIDKQCKVTLVDSGYNHSSIIAAGMINPLVFRRMTKSWRVDDFMPYANSFYKKEELETKTSFFHQIQIRRMFSTEQERELWIKKQERDDFKSYMEQVNQEDESYDKAINKFGSGRVKGGAYVDTSIFLSAMKEKIANHGALIVEEVSYNDIKGDTYKGNSYDHIIFCEGYLGVDNPWFGNLPLNQTQGETLTIKTTELPEDASLNRKCFVLPLGDHTFKVGSTYSWHNPDYSTTQEGKNKILENLSYLTDKEFEVIGHAAGVRPTTVDRRPLIGTHPENSQYHIFNGLGTKGYMMAPLLSKEFVDYLLKGQSLHPEVQISRFKDQGLL